MDEDLNTDYEITEYKGHKVFSVFDVDVESETPIVSFGIKKAKAILNHVQELQDFVDSEGKYYESVSIW